MTKTGTMDDTLLLDQPAWLGEVVAREFQALKPDELLFPFSSDDVAKAVKRTTEKLGLRKICAYQLRHGGASDDLLNRHRDSAEIKARGRWRTEASLRRYAKPVSVQRPLNALSPSATSFASVSLNRLEGLFRRTACPRTL